jgi:ABC-type antimicrobial peptide transport system permease subunit
MILKNLIRRPMRSLLTLLGIAIGVATVVSLGAMAQGMMKNYGSVVGLSNDLLVAQANAFDVAYSSLDAELEQRLAAVPGVDEVDPGVYGWIVTDEMPFFLVFGYHPGSTAMAHYRITEGKPVTGPRQIAIGRRAADSLKKGIGSTLRLFGVPYEIVGIYETGQALEESGGTVVLEDAQTITQKTRKVSLFQVGVRKGTDLTQVMARIEALEKDLAVSKSSEYDASQQWSQYLQGFAWGIAAIAILIGGLGMMNAMVMSVLERTREIGTLRAVGWSRRRVVTLILGETVVLSLIGGLVGIALGVGLTELAANAPGIGGMMEGVYSTGIFIQGLLTALCLGVLGGAYPAWVAANLLPVEALRYEGGGSGEVKGRLARVGNQSFRNLWRRRTRTFIAATGIGIGVATLVMMGGLIAGITGELNSLAGSSGTGNLTVMQRDVADMSMSSLDERAVSQIRNMPQVKSVSPMLLGFIISSDMPFFMVAGLDPNSAAMSHYKLVEGRYVQRPNEVLLGKIAAKTYKVGVDDTLKLFANRYKVVGIAETGVAWEEGGAMVALREAQRLLNRPRSVSFIFVDVTDPSQASVVRDAINRRFPEARASLSSEFAENTDDMANAQAMFAAISLLALFVGGIVVANTLLMSVHERTREIGTLRALGWAKGRILSQIMQESLLLCVISAIFGSTMGVLLLVLAAKAPGLNGLISARWDAQIFIQAIVLTLVVGLVASAYPAWRASRLQPVEALRYE